MEAHFLDEIGGTTATKWPNLTNRSTLYWTGYESLFRWCHWPKRVGFFSKTTILWLISSPLTKNENFRTSGNWGRSVKILVIAGRFAVFALLNVRSSATTGKKTSKRQKFYTWNEEKMVVWLCYVMIQWREIRKTTKRKTESHNVTAMAKLKSER